MKHSAFGGAIVFEMGYRTLETDMLGSDMQNAVPPQEDWPPSVASGHAVFTLVVPTTKSIVIDWPGEYPEPLTQLADFWQQVQEGRDYPALWEAFKKLPGEIVDEWWEAFQRTKLSALFAPLEIQPGTGEGGEGAKKKGSSGGPK